MYVDVCRDYWDRCCTSQVRIMILRNRGRVIFDLEGQKLDFFYEGQKLDFFL
jgi:hypothetical protein